MFEKFESWDALLAFLERDARLVWYHAPMDARPCLVRVVKVYKNRKVRIDPLSHDADHFTADSGHLDRFRRQGVA